MNSELPEFSLLGGPLYRLGCRFGLVKRKNQTLALGLVLGIIPWVILMAFAFIDGIANQLFSLSLIGGHVRLLLVIPLFFVCESLLDPRVTGFVQRLVHSGIITSGSLPTFKAEVARVMRWKNFWLAEALCLLVAVLFTRMGSHLQLTGTTTAFDPSRALTEHSLAGWWYWNVCLTLFRFLVFRWLWTLGLWCFFLWRVARLELRLVPIHPDGVAGLGNLETVHSQFTPLIFAISALQSASFAEAISAGQMSFEAIYPALAMIFCMDALLFLAPLFIFAPLLWMCRINGLRDYMQVAGDYVTDFDNKWVRATKSRNELLGTPDLQSLADLSNSVKVVRDMRLAPIGPRLLTEYMIAAVLPLLPLLLLKYPLATLAEKFFTNLTGF